MNFLSLETRTQVCENGRQPYASGYSCLASLTASPCLSLPLSPSLSPLLSLPPQVYLVKGFDERHTDTSKQAKKHADDAAPYLHHSCRKTLARALLSPPLLNRSTRYSASLGSSLQIPHTHSMMMIMITMMTQTRETHHSCLRLLSFPLSLTHTSPTFVFHDSNKDGKRKEPRC